MGVAASTSGFGVGARWAGNVIQKVLRAGTGGEERAATCRGREAGDGKRLRVTLIITVNDITLDCGFVLYMYTTDD